MTAYHINILLKEVLYVTLLVSDKSVRFENIHKWCAKYHICALRQKTWVKSQSVFCPCSFAQTKTEGMELPDTFSLGKEQAQFFVLMRSLGIYMLHRDWTERKRPLTYCRPRLSTRSRASLWSLPLNSLSRYMTSMTMSPNLPRLSTLPVYLKCQTSVSEWKLLFLSVLLFEVHLLSCWNTAPGCDIPVTAVFLRSWMPQCHWFFWEFFFPLLQFWQVFGACSVMEWSISELDFHNVLFCLLVLLLGLFCFSFDLNIYLVLLSFV